MEQILEKLFESVPKVKILRLFTRNPDQYFTFTDLEKRTQVPNSVLGKELQKLKKLDLIRQKRITYQEKIPTRRGKKIKMRVKKTKPLVYYINTGFRIFTELCDLITKESTASHKKIFKNISSLGNIKLAVISGAFLKNSDYARTDILIVGDNIKKKRLNRFLAKAESEIGKSLHYTLMGTKEFEYRKDMYDRFLRDILEYPHEKLINKLKI